MALGLLLSPLLPLLLWGAYLSLVNAGGWQRNYGWDWLTLEVGFLVIFLYPITPLLTTPRSSHPSHAHSADNPVIVIYLLRALAFRLLLGAGMSKLGGSSSECWLQLSCTGTHYSTQPMPNPLSWWAHVLPQPIHQFEVP